MGPRLHSRGMDRSTQNYGKEKSSFNGAAASQPRNAVISADPRTQRRGRFNGAAASQPRNGRQQGVVQHGRQASMGPRLHSRGMNSGGWTVRIYRTASMGPRLHSRGMDERSLTGSFVDRSFNGAAASQPRNAVPASEDGPTLHAASMGPRLHSRGMQYPTSTLGSRFIMLQWGRGFTAAECGGGTHCPPPICLLQWGRGFTAAECDAPRPARTHPRVASMGPRLHSRGMFQAAARSSLAYFCFNGAAASQPRNDQEHFGGRVVHGRFNGAAASQPRNAGPDRRVGCGGQASMGPRLHSRGMSRGGRSRGGRPRGFNGAAASQPRNGLSIRL